MQNPDRVLNYWNFKSQNARTYEIMEKIFFSQLSGFLCKMEWQIFEYD